MRKKIVIIFMMMFIFLMILGIGIMRFIDRRDKSISLYEDRIVIEYGNTYHPTINDLINLAEYDFIDLEKVKLETNLENEEDKEYPAVGEYEVNINYKNISLKQTVEVKDTTAPEISIKDNIESPFETDLAMYNFQELMSVSDLSQINDYNIDTNHINVKSSGEYIAKVSVTDCYLNKAEREFKIKVQEKMQEEKEKEIAEDNSNKIQKKEVMPKTATAKQEKPQVNSKITETNKPIITQTAENNGANNNKNVESTSTKNHTTENNIPSNTQNNASTPSDLTYWCAEGGSHHVLGDGANEHGYYSSWAEAESACDQYMQGWLSEQHKIDQCACGLYYFWAIQE